MKGRFRGSLAYRVCRVPHAMQAAQFELHAEDRAKPLVVLWAAAKSCAT